MKQNNPLLSTDLFVGRHDQLAEVGGLARHGHSILLIGGRRAGKSTLARQLTDLNVGRRVVRADASGWDLSTERSALGGLRSAIEERAETTYPEATRNDVVRALQQISPLVLVIDEADRVLQMAWCAGFFAFLRYLDDTLFRSKISIMLIGGPVLTLFRDPQDRGSPPLNTAHPIFMNPLDDSAVDQLVGMAAKTDLDRADVMRLGGGQAFLTTRLLADVWAGQPLRAAAESVFDQCQTTFEAWERQLGSDGRELYRIIPPEGVAVGAFHSGAWGRFRRAQRFARSIGVLQVIEGRLQIGTALFKRWMSNRDPDLLTWDVAISYAPEDEGLAWEVAGRVRKHLTTFFGPDESAFLWGPDTTRALPNTFEVECRCHLVISTPAYVNKHWVAGESDQEIEENSHRVIFLDCGAVPATVRHHSVIGGWEKLSPIDLAEAILAEAPDQ